MLVVVIINNELRTTYVYGMGHQCEIAKLMVFQYDVYLYRHLSLVVEGTL